MLVRLWAPALCGAGSGDCSPGGLRTGMVPELTKAPRFLTLGWSEGSCLDHRQSPPSSKVAFPVFISTFYTLTLFSIKHKVL